jgi:hypothetical protein
MSATHGRNGKADFEEKLKKGATPKANPKAGRAAPPPPPPPPEPEDIETMDVPGAPPWPALDPAAYHGLSGAIVRAIEPETEADPVAILGQLLVAFGSAAGRTAYFPVEGNRHYANLFAVVVGRSARGRKGTSWGRAAQAMGLADRHWLDHCVGEGLSSGEGLIGAVRDPVTKANAEGEREVIDEGVTDKRLCVVEGEFARCLSVMSRQGNTLSPTVRNLWDSGRASILTKASCRATDAHVSIIGHITRDELAGHLGHTEMLNGFANRFLWLLAKRSKLLPGGGRALDLTPFHDELDSALRQSRRITLMARSDATDRLWHDTYERLTEDHNGLFGAVTSRADAQTLRLSMLYALLDGQDIIDEEHLRAALAFWAYAESSARIIFGEVPDDPLVDRILKLLAAADPEGLTKTDLHNALSRNVAAKATLDALATLREKGEGAVRDGEDRPAGGTGRAVVLGVRQLIRLIRFFVAPPNAQTSYLYSIFIVYIHKREYSLPLWVGSECPTKERIKRINSDALLPAGESPCPHPPPTTTPNASSSALSSAPPTSPRSTLRASWSRTSGSMRTAASGRQ